MGKVVRKWANKKINQKCTQSRGNRYQEQRGLRWNCQGEALLPFMPMKSWKYLIFARKVLPYKDATGRRMLYLKAVDTLYMRIHPCHRELVTYHLLIMRLCAQVSRFLVIWSYMYIPRPE